MSAGPPRSWQRLLAMALRSQDRDAALGDLAEEHALRKRRHGEAFASSWYRGQVLRSLVPALVVRLGVSWNTVEEGIMGRMWQDRWQDVRYALRTLGRNPGFAAVLMATLGLGVGAATTVFTVVEGVLLRPLPYAEPHRLYTVGQEGDEGHYWYSAPNFEDVRSGLSSFEALAAYAPDGANVVGEGEPERIRSAEASAGLFRVLGLEPALGRTFTEEEERAGARVAVVSHGLWTRRLGASPAALGSELVLDGAAFEVVGVLPPGPALPRDAEVWTPIRFDAPEWRTRRGITWFMVVGRLKGDVPLEAARAEALVLSRTLREEHPEENAHFAIGLRSLEEATVGPVRRELSVLMASVLVVLLVACVNVGGLLLARATARSAEIGVRTALGVGRPRLAAQLLTESAVVAALGCLLGLGFARAGVAALLSLAPPGTPRLEEVGMGGPALLFALAASAAAALLFGTLPLREALRVPARSLAPGRWGASSAGTRVRDALVVAQVALALVLLTGAGLLGKSFWRLELVDPGFDPSGVLVAGLPVAESDFAGGEERTAYFAELLERARRIPGVVTAALTNAAPFASSGPVFSYELREPPPDPGARLLARFRVVTPELFEALDIPILAGRTFSADEARSGGEPVVVVSEELVRRHFAGVDPLGQEVRTAGEWYRIVGVAGAVRDASLRDPSPLPHLYVPVSPATRQSMALVLRTGGDPHLLLDPLRRAIREVAPSQPLTPARALSSFLGDATARPRFTLVVLAFFAWATLLLAAMGIYGALAYQVGRRTREIGVRLALGADSGRMRRSVVRHALGLAAVGLLAGTAIAWWGTPLLGALLFEVEARDPAVGAAVASALLLVSVLAAWLPAARAARVSPQEALRAD